MKRFAALFPPVVILLTAFALYTPYFNRIMYCDEANTLYQYASDPVRALLSYATPNNHILHSLQVWAVTSLAGPSAPVTRFPALAAALIAVALAYRVGSRLASRETSPSTPLYSFAESSGLRRGELTGQMPSKAIGRGIGLLAAAFLATSFGFADYAINARGYTMAIALTLALIDLVWATPPPRFRRRTFVYSLMGICAALMLTLPTMALAIGSAGLWALWRWRVSPAKDRRYSLLILPLIIGTLSGSIVYLPSLFNGLVGSHLGMFGENSLATVSNDLSGMLFGLQGVGLVFLVTAGIGIVLSVMRCSRDPFLSIFVCLVGVGLLAMVGQYVLTGKALFARNYLYLIAPITLCAGYAATLLPHRFVVPAAVLLLVASIIPFRALDGNYLEKQVNALVDARVQPTDWLIVGPCFNVTVQHHLEQTSRAELLYNRPGVTRALVVTREGTLEENLSYFDAVNQVTTCQPLSDPEWSLVNAYTCTPLPPS